MTVLLLLVAAGTRPATAQSWYLGWLKAAEEWSLEKNYRGWILHGAIATVTVLAADWIAGAPEYGAVIGSGFYLGKEIREMDHWSTGLDLDRVMDMATPVLSATITAFLLMRNDRGPFDEIVPPVVIDPCAAPLASRDKGEDEADGPLAIALPRPNGCYALRLAADPPAPLPSDPAPVPLPVCTSSPSLPLLCARTD